MEGTLTDPFNFQNSSFFCHETGIYSSMHAPRALPKDPLQDVVSFLFSHQHEGIKALVDSSSGFSISYTELQSMVQSMACGLQKLGILQNQVVLILLPNSILYPVIFLGVLAIGAIATTMNPLCSTEEIEKSMKGCNLVSVFTTSENVAKVDGLGVWVVQVPQDIYFDAEKFSHFNWIISSDPKKFVKPKIRQTDTGAILHSSGTSGFSKGVVLTHGNLIASIELFVRFEASQYKEKSWENVYLAALPMFHVYGLSLFVIGLLSLGSMIVVMRRFDVEEAAIAINLYKVTHFPVVPPILGVLVKAVYKNGCVLRSLKQVSCGAAPVSKKLIEDFVKIFPHVDFIQGYGMTETTAVGTRGFSTKKFKKHSSAGLLAPNMQAKVVDCKNGACLPPGKSGELFLCGPGIMKGYLNNEQATSSMIDEEGWLRTGDIAYFDQDGYLYVLDRLKDTIKYKGFQIAPADIEAILISHPEILDAGVASCEDEEAGEIPVAYVVRRPGSMLASCEVMDYVAKQVAPYKKVRKVVFVDSIPKSPAGKILRRLLKNNNRASRM
nr:4-coumarate:CoA ligase 6 [Crinum x powellii]